MPGSNLWLGSKLLGDLYFMRGVIKTKMGDSSFFDRIDQSVRADISAPYTEKVEELLVTLENAQAAVERGEMTAPEGAAQVCDLVQNADWLPHTVYGWGGPAANIDFTPTNACAKLFSIGVRTPRPHGWATKCSILSRRGSQRRWRGSKRPRFNGKLYSPLDL